MLREKLINGIEPKITTLPSEGNQKVEQLKGTGFRFTASFEKKDTENSRT